ncbi:MAG: ABC transporter permease subunit [Acidobacteriota bacterium]
MRRRPELWLLVVALVAGAVAFVVLDLHASRLWPEPASWRRLGRFALAAFQPALTHSGDVPTGTPSLLAQVASGIRWTLVFAAGATSLAFVLGLPMGLLVSQATWSPEQVPSRAWRGVARAGRGVVRSLAAVLRSIHELLWAVLFLAAFGLSSGSAVLALTLPLLGTFIKLFAELLDETPRDVVEQLRGSGAGAVTALLVGLLPRAWPDLLSYLLYRFECTLRASAVLGFFGWPTLGYHLKLEWNAGDDHEAWTHLWALVLLVWLVDRWSRSLRARLVA